MTEPSFGNIPLPLNLGAASNIAAAAAGDSELLEVREHLIHLDPEGRRFASVLRDTIDQLLNGEVTGRYDWKTLFKTEKTHAGTLVEINMQREFKFDDGSEMDYRIAGVDVDCKYSQQFGGWMIPPEAVGHLCLLLWADDYKSRWSAGLLRIRKDFLNQGNNRDLKLTVKAAHRDKISWLWKDSELPENILLHMESADRESVFTQRSGQARLNELFRRAQKRRIGRGVIRTVAQQKDYMKRVRKNGGSRSTLRKEGILIIGDYSSHRDIAASLQIPIPQKGEFVSVQVAEAASRHGDLPRVTLDGRKWVCADADDPVTWAPELPAHTR